MSDNSAHSSDQILRETDLTADNTNAPKSGFMAGLKGLLFRFRILLLLLWVLGLFAIGYAGIERRFAVPDKNNLDKFVHVGVFAAMAFWPIMVCGRRKISMFLVFIVVLGAPGLELMQAHFGNGRIASLADMTASLCGVALGAVIAWFARRIG